MEQKGRLQNRQLDKTNKVQELFSSHDPDAITDILLEELNRVVRKLVFKIKVQKKASQEQFWNKNILF